MHTDFWKCDKVKIIKKFKNFFKGKRDVEINILLKEVDGIRVLTEKPDLCTKAIKLLESDKLSIRVTSVNYIMHFGIFLMDNGRKNIFIQEPHIRGKPKTCWIGENDDEISNFFVKFIKKINKRSVNVNKGVLELLKKCESKKQRTTM